MPSLVVVLLLVGGGLLLAVEPLGPVEEPGDNR
jgi:hypothetical protein